VLDLLFVYGTLRSAFDNLHARRLRSGAVMAGAARVRGAIYRVRHYPAYKHGPEGAVYGEIYRLRDPEKTLRSLDAYEGRDFERVVVEGYWLYRYLPEPPADSRILSGDFCAP
jgi:gamma-glutamylcyclotransferase (GGCT)/AIG2-like uncharacterized protein YtfP